MNFAFNLLLSKGVVAWPKVGESRFALLLGLGILCSGLSVSLDAALAAGPAVVNSAPPVTFCVDRSVLQEIQIKIRTGSTSVSKLAARLKLEADQCLRQKLEAVTDKQLLAPSGDKHDYVSLSTYFWPNPATTNGLPYVLRDGETNPEVRQYDFSRLQAMSGNVRILALAYYLTGNERYAERAAIQLRRWFLDSATRMNPNLKYGQLVKGMNEGSRWGIIDTWMLPWVVDADGLLQGSPVWTQADQKALKQWFADYLAWLRNSRLGQAEAKASNNHGSYYDFQVADFALFTGQSQVAHEVLENAKTRRIASQIEPDGSQPEELLRTKSYDYCVFNLIALFDLARLGDVAGVDLWHYHTTDGRSLRRALDWMIPYATDEKPWTHKQIVPRGSSQTLADLLREAASVFEEPNYGKVIPQLRGIDQEDLLFMIFQGAT
jgi:hypothetical protein